MEFKIVKHFSLDFLGDEWKEAYIDFKPLTINDMRDKLPDIAKLQEQDADLTKGLDSVIGLLEKKFISGKALGDNGVLQDLKVEDLKDLPIDVMGRAFSFLSETKIESSSTPSQT